jgi:NAD(P)-dependent dehydrogenase (short-subunit alcohol dehydrogenase family)
MRKVIRGYAKDKNLNLILIGTIPVPHSKGKRSPAARQGKIIDVNVVAAFLMTRAVLPSLLAQQWGRIITTSLDTPSRERRPSNLGSRQYQKASADFTEKVGVWLYGNASEISLGIAQKATDRWRPYSTRYCGTR